MCDEGEDETSLGGLGGLDLMLLDNLGLVHGRSFLSPRPPLIPVQASVCVAGGLLGGSAGWVGHSSPHLSTCEVGDCYCGQDGVVNILLGGDLLLGGDDHVVGAAKLNGDHPYVPELSCHSFA